MPSWLPFTNQTEVRGTSNRFENLLSCTWFECLSNVSYAKCHKTAFLWHMIVPSDCQPMNRDKCEHCSFHFCFRHNNAIWNARSTVYDHGKRFSNSLFWYFFLPACSNCYHLRQPRQITLEEVWTIRGLFHCPRGGPLLMDDFNRERNSFYWSS